MRWIKRLEDVFFFFFREKAKTPAVALLPLSTHVCTYAGPPTHTNTRTKRASADLCQKTQ